MAKTRMLKMGLMIGFVFLLAACGTKSVPSKTTTVSTPASGFFPAGAFVSGEWTLEFKADGTFSINGPTENDLGTYTSTANQMVLTTQSCGNVKGTYLWRFDGQSPLILKGIDDQCTDRLDVLTSSSWAVRP